MATMLPHEEIPQRSSNVSYWWVPDRLVALNMVEELEPAWGGPAAEETS